MDNQLIETADKKTQQVSCHTYTDLLAEQARIVARLSEITSILSSDNSTVSQNTPPPKQQSFLKDFDRKAYAMGLIWRNPEISTRQLAKKVGVAQSTLFLPSWSDVAAILRGRKNNARDNYKNHHIDEELGDDHERYQ